MSPRFVKAIAVLVAVHLVGGHWMLLQTAAWVGMFVSFSQEESVVVALEKTLDGEHPCNVCEVVTKGKTEEKKQEQVKSLLKFDAVIAPAGRLLVLEYAPTEYPAQSEHWSERALAPPTPPPLAS